jgi:hypothetical protein
MKVEEPHTRFREFKGQVEIGRERTKTAQKERITEKEEKPAPFAEKLRLTSLQIRTKEELDVLIKEIDEKGEELLKSPTYEHLIEYKELVAVFIKKAVTGIWQVEERKSGRFAQTQKVYILVKKIDDKLASLTEEVLKDQKDPIALASCLDDIRGLLIDLYS